MLSATIQTLHTLAHERIRGERGCNPSDAMLDAGQIPTRKAAHLKCGDGQQNKKVNDGHNSMLAKFDLSQILHILHLQTVEQ